MITAQAPAASDKPCGHAAHVGCCPACQRALIALHAAQLLAAQDAAASWHAEHLH